MASVISWRLVGRSNGQIMFCRTYLDSIYQMVKTHLDLKQCCTVSEIQGEIICTDNMISLQELALSVEML